MDTFKDLLLSIRDWFKDRVGNPFFASFLVAWLVLNWRVVLVLFSDMTALEKITWLDKRLYPEWWHWTYFGLIAPLCTAALYVGISPHVLRKVSVYHRKEQHKSTTAILAADAVQPISPDRAERLINERVIARLELRQVRARFAELETDYLDQIEKLQEQLKPKPSAVENETVNVESKELDSKPHLFQIGESLSDKATQILDASARSNNGFIEYRKYINGKVLKAGDKNLLTPNVSPREIADWEAAISELKTNALIQSDGENRYKLTKLGYDIYDALLSKILIQHNPIGGAPLGGAPL